MTASNQAASKSSATGSTLTLVGGTRIWERQPLESTPAYDAFCIYMTVREEQLGGIREVARRVKKSGSLIGRWSQRWKWVDRYRAYENHNLIRTEHEQQKALKAGAALWAERRLSTREDGFALGRALMERARSLLQLPVFDKIVHGTIETADGQIVETVTTLNFQQHPRDARLLAETGLKLMRLSADMSTENLGLMNRDINFDAMSDEELDAYADQLLEIKQQTSAG